MEATLVVIAAILVIGLSAVTLARRPRQPCTACRRGELEIAADFTHRCTTCGARFRRVAGRLEPL